ncbi:MAG TPA: hypothetical protein VKV57_02755 [bacterium]|nr:hypothetical protein [bacterium]
MRRKSAVALAVLVSAVILLGEPGGAAPGVKSVGVVDFYSPTPLGVFVGVFPERFAADDLSAQLARAANGRFTVIPRGTMERAEGSLRWQDVDVLHYDRLGVLARSVGADALILGWIPLLSVDAGGGGMAIPPDGEGPPNAEVNLVIQVFDAAQGRRVAETRQAASALGTTRSLLTQRVLHDALVPAVAPVADALTAPAP